MGIADGTYKITNESSKYQIRPKGNDTNSPVVTGTDDGSNAFKWIFTQQANKSFTIVSKANDKYAFVGAAAQPPATVVMNSDSQSFFVKEYNAANNVYTIATVDSGNFWGVNTPQSDISVVLGDNEANQRNQWVIIKA